MGKLAEAEIGEDVKEKSPTVGADTEKTETRNRLPMKEKLGYALGDTGGVLAFGVVGSFLQMFYTSNPYVFLAFCLLSGLGISFFTLEVWALVIDVIDYQELLSGKREEGTSYACFSFTRKLGQTIAGIGSSIALAAIGYKTAANITAQTDTVIRGMYGIATIVPFVIYLGIFIILQFAYPLNKSSLVTVNNQLKSRRNKNSEAAD